MTIEEQPEDTIGLQERPKDGAERPKPKRLVRTSTELHRSAKSRRYSAAMRRRWKRIRRERNRYRWVMGLTPPTADEAIKVDEALKVGYLVRPRGSTERLQRLFARTCNRLDQPFATITIDRTHGTATLHLDIGRRPRVRFFLDEAVQAAQQTLPAFFRAVGRGPWRFSNGGELVDVPGVPLNCAHDLMRALLALPTQEFHSGGFMIHGLHGAPADNPDSWSPADYPDIWSATIFHQQVMAAAASAADVERGEVTSNKPHAGINLTRAVHRMVEAWVATNRQYLLPWSGREFADRHSDRAFEASRPADHGLVDRDEKRTTTAVGQGNGVAKARVA